MKRRRNSMISEKEGELLKNNYRNYKSVPPALQQDFWLRHAAENTQRQEYEQEQGQESYSANIDGPIILPPPVPNSQGIQGTPADLSQYKINIEHQQSFQGEVPDMEYETCTKTTFNR